MFLAEEKTYPTTWQRQLVDIYSTKRGHIGFHPGLTSEEFPSDEYFVDLQLVKEQKSTTKVKQVELETYSDLLRLQDDKGRCLNHVLVSGHAGMGKTTMISRLAHQWAIEKRTTTKQGRLSALINIVIVLLACGCYYHILQVPLFIVLLLIIFTFNIRKSNATNMGSLLHKFKYVFALDLRKCGSDKCLVDEIESHLLSNVSKHHLESFLTNHASECLYLFDGYDEMSANETILHSNLLCGSRVIVTTRPNKVDAFYESHKEYVQVISEGFSKESINKFVKTYFGNSKEISESLLKTIYDNPEIETLSHFPLVLSMICVIWKDKNTLPSTLSELYCQTIQYLARHWRARDYSSMPFEEFKNHVQFDQIMVRLGRTALRGLLHDSTLVFKKDEFDSFKIVEQGCSLGIMSKSSEVSEFDIITYFSFIHKTFQEHCAAVYISSVADSENHEFFMPDLYQMNVNEMEYVLRFCCGTSQKAAEFVLTYIVDDVVKNATQNDPIKQICTLPLVLLYEAESKFGVINSLHTILSPAVVNIKMYIDDYHDDPAYEAALQYFIDKFDTQTVWTEQVQMAELYHRSRYESTCSKFENSKQVELLAKMLHLKKLKIVSLYASNRPSLKFEYINRLVNSLEDLTLKNYIISTESVYEFLNTPSHSARLHLDSLMADKDTNPEKLSHVLQVLHSTGGSIRKLEVDECDMKQVIAYVTPFYSTLEGITPGITLHIAGFTQECVDTMCDGIIQTCHKISSQEVTYGEHEHTADSIVDQPCVCLPLQKLDLSRNDISHSGNKLRTIFPFLGCLKRLKLYHCSLMENDFQSLGPALSTLHNLQHLNLSENNIGNSLNEVIQGINHSKITHLNLHNTQLTKESKQNLSHLQLPLLEEINLPENDIDSREAEALSVSLKHMPQLRKLNLGCNSIGSHGAEALFESFQHTPHLEALDLRSNAIEYLTLGSSCQSLPSLVYLSLRNSALNSDGAIALSSYFQYTPQLTQLDISFNPIGTKGLEAIFRNLHHLPELGTLFLPPFPKAKWSAKLASVFHVRRSNPHNALVEACIKSLKQNDLWEDGFYTRQWIILYTQHIKDIAQVAKLHPACST